ncbi:MAG: hypothetical protein U0S50_11705 [Sphingopyxis sp.]|uniref:hypothetical protein n=1 Tax=Sphingopyxis sp. TaxID=1908224 RepID=UPI002ABCF5E6|nr:hypothetical protein [Sphingopyxis sp.]MDZ3832467.1 hypothetical protein [Sphingopyxis sp.]
MLRLTLTLGCLSFGAVAAHAAPCEDGFVKKGNAVTGLRFIATTSVPGMSPASGVGQLKGIVAAKGYDVIAAEPESGTMLIEQPQTGKARPFPIEIAVDSAGSVRMEAKLRPTMSVPDAAAKAEMCGILTQLKGGKAGEALAARGMKAETAVGAPIRMSVLRFSQDVSGQAAKNSAVIAERYKNKSFTLYGPVAYVGGRDGRYWIEFKLVSNVLTDIVPGRSASLGVTCQLASGNSAYALGLKPDKHVELTGTFDRYEQGFSTVWLKDCRPVK